MTDLSLKLELAEEALQKLRDPAVPVSAISVVVYQLATLLNDESTRTSMHRAMLDTGNLEGEADSIRAELAHSSTNPFEALTRSSMLLRQRVITASLVTTRASLITYAAAAQKQLRFSHVASDLFERTRARVDAIVRTQFADAADSFAIAYEQLRSANPENWSLATTACRRLLKAVADHVFPAQDEPRVMGTDGGKTKKVELTDSNYRNRLIAFVEDNSSSERFTAVVGSHLQLLIDRLQAIDESLSKGVHARVSREEADAYVLFTYLLVGDILTLLPPSDSQPKPSMP